MLKENHEEKSDLLDILFIIVFIFFFFFFRILFLISKTK